MRRLLGFIGRVGKAFVEGLRSAAAVLGCCGPRRQCTFTWDQPADGARERRQDAVSKQLLTQNLYSWGDKAEITHLAWLVLPEGKKSGLPDH